MTSPRTLTINVANDSSDGIWYVLSSDILGLNAEASSLDELIAIVSDIAPDLIAANLCDQ